MKWSDRKDILHNVLSTGRVGSGGEVRAQECPFCGSTTKEPFQINSITGWYHCFACGESGLCPGFYAEPQAPSLCRKVLVGELPTIDPPPGYELLTWPPPHRQRDAWHYLTGKEHPCRGMRRDAVLKAGIGCCLRGRYYKRVIVPVYDQPEPTRWLGWIGRSWDKGAKWPYTNDEAMDRARLLFRPWLLDIKSDVPLLCGEGVFDAVHGGEATATFGKMSDQQIDTIIRAWVNGQTRPLVLMYDGDARHHGYYTAQRFRMRGYQVSSLGLGPKRDPDYYPREVLQEAARRAISEDRVEVAL